MVIIKNFEEVWFHNIPRQLNFGPWAQGTIAFGAWIQALDVDILIFQIECGLWPFPYINKGHGSKNVMLRSFIPCNLLQRPHATKSE